MLNWKCVGGDGRNWEQNWESGEWEEREISIISLSPPTETCQRSSEPSVQNPAAPSLTRTWKPCSEYNLLTHQLHHWKCPIFIVYACWTNYTTLGGWSSDKILLILSQEASTKTTSTPMNIHLISNGYLHQHLHHCRELNKGYSTKHVNLKQQKFGSMLGPSMVRCLWGKPNQMIRWK